ncbi:MAG: 16S rRNA (guanine966-N2)-methyltransferase [Psychrobacter glaciei]|jgi:16S rRNA (guanine966-N2)-methyltransferase
MAKKTGSRLRIIGGKWRSRMLPIADVEGLRPTTDRVRETVFNWLQPYLYGANVLDVFAGSGVLGFEALSREAASATLIEKNKLAIKNLNENAKTLGAQNISIIQTDALIWLTSCTEQFDVIFLDPPFNKGLLPDCINLINDNNLVKTNSWVYIESEGNLSDLPIPRHWHLFREKQAGMVMLRLFKVEAST